MAAFADPSSCGSDSLLMVMLTWCAGSGVAEKCLLFN